VRRGRIPPIDSEGVQEPYGLLHEPSAVRFVRRPLILLDSRVTKTTASTANAGSNTHKQGSTNPWQSAARQGDVPGFAHLALCQTE
jgi:hypothetical protein